MATTTAWIEDSLWLLEVAALCPLTKRPERAQSTLNHKPLTGGLGKAILWKPGVFEGKLKVVVFLNGNNNSVDRRQPASAGGCSLVPTDQ